MMDRRVFTTSLLATTGLALTACSKFKQYNGPEVTSIVVFKGDRKMYLLNGNTALTGYDVGLGFTPEGHKEKYGDGKTPEGVYRIDRRNPESTYHLSLGVSYPNEDDRARALEAKENPGGDIFIHGGPIRREDKKKRDWTAGCIAVTDREIEEIYSMVRVGTPIFIYA